jgi:hypothetical protein
VFVTVTKVSTKEKQLIALLVFIVPLVY